MNKKLTTEQIDFIENNFFYSEHLEKEKFESLTSTFELDYIIKNYNWDNGLELIKWISNSKLCSKATAIEVFWLCCPRDFLKYDLEKKSKDETFEIIKVILNNLSVNFYNESEISFDPSPFLENLIIPESMLLESKGEQTYLYYSESDYISWFGEFLENKINNCENSMELFSIAYYVKKPNIARLIMNHKFCDKGIAKMLFWRLKTYGGLWTESDEVMKLLILGIENNKFNECINYNPLKDPNIEVSKRNKWEIPEIVKHKV